MKNWKRKILSDVCKLSSDRININKLSVKNYISTENLLQNKGGKVDASALPSAGQVVAFSPKMTLVSNIRPYFRKIYFSDSYGGCSNDVLAFIAKEGVSEKWLYYLLSQDAFFDYVMSGAKGTKMPRGDKTQIMNFPLYLPPFPEQVKMAHILDAIDEKISASNKINQNLDWEDYFSICRKIIKLEKENQNLEAQAQAIFKSWFVDFEPFGKKKPEDWKEYRLGDFLPIITGKKNANVSSQQGKYPFFSCAQDIAWTENFSFDANAILVAGNGDFNVKFYNGKFEAYQRTYVLIPYNPKLTNWLYYVVKYNLGKITSGARGSVIKFITKGNLENFSFFAPSNLNDLDLIDFFNSANNKIAENKLEILQLSQLRDALLPKLMSGEIDVSEVAV